MLLGREITAEDVEPLTWELAQIGHERDGGRYLMDVGLHQGLSRMIAGWFESGYDLLLTPTMAEVPPPIGAIDTHEPNLAAYERCLPSGAFTALFNVTGQPAISLPLHWTDEGLPSECSSSPRSAARICSYGSRHSSSALSRGPTGFRPSSLDNLRR